MKPPMAKIQSGRLVFSCIAFLAGLLRVAAGPAAGDLPALIREAEKGVLFLRVVGVEGAPVSLGTGFLVNDKGTVVTSLHVLRAASAKAERIEALSADGTVFKVKGLSAWDEPLDLARLELEQAPNGAVPLRLSESRPPERGERVMVMGHPQGFRFVSTEGIVSAVSRPHELPAAFRDSLGFQSGGDEVLIQTSAAVSPGNSGGPMIDAGGRVIGIVQWKAGGEGMNFALHVASVRGFLTRPTSLTSVSDFVQPYRELATLIDEFREACERYTGSRDRHPSMVHLPKLLALRNEHPESGAAFRALETIMWAAMGHGCPAEIAETVRRAGDDLLAAHRKDRRLLPLLRARLAPTLPEARDFLRKLAAGSGDVEMQILAGLSLAVALDQDPKAVDHREEIEHLARQVASAPADLLVDGTGVASLGEELRARVSESYPGCKAPELAGTDTNGEPIRLTELRGQHVLVVFWDRSGEFFNSVPESLERIIQDYQIKTVGVRIGDGSGFRDEESASKSSVRVVQDGAPGVLRKAWHIAVSPTAFLIDPEGVIIGRIRSRVSRSFMIGNGASGIASFSSTSGNPWVDDLIARIEAIPEVAGPRKKLMEFITAVPWVAAGGWDPRGKGERTVFFRQDGTTTVEWIHDWELRPPAGMHIHLRPGRTGCTDIAFDFETGEARVTSPESIRDRVMRRRSMARSVPEESLSKLRDCLTSGKWNWYDNGDIRKVPYMTFGFRDGGKTTTAWLPTWEVTPEGDVRLYRPDGTFWSFDFDPSTNIARSNLEKSHIKDRKAFTTSAGGNRPGSPSASSPQSIVPLVEPENGNGGARPFVPRPRPGDASDRQIDLSGFYNGSFRQGWLPSNQWSQRSQKNLPSLAEGVVALDGVTFDARGVVQTRGSELPVSAGFPDAVEGIIIGRRATVVHFLQGSAWDVPEGTRIGHYIVQYGGGEAVAVPLIYGRNIRDWTASGLSGAKPSMSGAPEVHRDQNGYSERSPGSYVRLFDFRWRNPRPDDEILSIDLVSALTRSAPFLIALSLESAD